MSPTESRNGTNMNRVRFFGQSQLQKSTAQEKWDKVKIVCTQPYNKVRASYLKLFVKYVNICIWNVLRHCYIAAELENSGVHLLYLIL